MPPPRRRLVRTPSTPPRSTASSRAAVGEHLHARRVLSLANGVVGVLHITSVAIHAIGEALAAVRDLNPKHAVKQIDRLLRNAGLDVEAIAPRRVTFVLADRTDAVVAMDWTDFDADEQTTLVINLVSSHGRATPLLWKTVHREGLKDRRNGCEAALPRRLREAGPTRCACRCWPTAASATRSSTPSCASCASST